MKGGEECQSVSDDFFGICFELSAPGSEMVPISFDHTAEFTHDLKVLDTQAVSVV